MAAAHDVDALIAQQLNDAARLCSDAGEAQVMYDQVRRRLESLAAALRMSHQDASLTAAELELELADVVGRFVAFLIRIVRRDVVYRLASSRVVVAHVRSFHEELEHLLSADDAQSDVHAWQNRFENARENVWLTLDELSRDRMALMRDLFDLQSQQDALTLIMYEHKRPAGMYTPAERQVVQNAFNTITRFSRAKAPVLPSWFLPLYDVAFALEAACKNASVEVWRGTFGAAEGEQVPVVIKVVHANVAEKLEGFMHQVSVWFDVGRVNRHVVRLYGASHVGDVSFVVEDVAGSSSLRAFVAREPQRLWEALHGAALGLQALHNRGIVHGRLEAGGVLITADGTAKIRDNLVNFLGLLEPRETDDEGDSALQKVSKRGGQHLEPATLASDVKALGACILNVLGGSKATLGGQETSLGDVPAEQWVLIQRMCSERPDKRPTLTDVVTQFGAFAEAERMQREAAEAERMQREAAEAERMQHEAAEAERMQREAAEAERMQREAVEMATIEAQAQKTERRESAVASDATHVPEKPSRQQLKEARKREKEAQRQEKKAHKLSKQDSDKGSCIVQ